MVDAGFVQRAAIPRVEFATPIPVFEFAVRFPKAVASPVDEITKVSIFAFAGSPPK